MRYIYYQIVDKKIADLSGDAYIMVQNLEPFHKFYSNLVNSRVKLINGSAPYKEKSDGARLFRFKIIDEITLINYQSNISLVKPDTTKEIWFRVTDFSQKKVLIPGDIIKYSIYHNEDEDEFYIFICKILRYDLLLENKLENKYFLPMESKLIINQEIIDLLMKFNIKKTNETTTRGKNSIEYTVFEVKKTIAKKFIGINKQFNLIEYFDDFKEIINE